MWEWLLIPIAYALGSVSNAIIVCRFLNLPDPREEGSGNPGATNVLRYGGKKAAAITLIGDVLKGLVPVLLGRMFGLGDIFLAAVGFAAFLGPLYPIFFNYQGGKGIATASGVLLGFSWWVGVVVILTWLGMFKVSRISSLSAISAAILAPLYVWLFTASPGLIWGALLLSILSIWRHRDNIRRLLAGQESRMGS